MKRNPVGWTRIERKREEAARVAREAAKTARDQEEKNLIAERAKAEAESQARIAEAEASKRRAAAQEAKAKAKTAQLELQKLEAEERIMAERRAAAEVEATIELNRKAALERVNQDDSKHERELLEAQEKVKQLQTIAAAAIKQAETAAAEHEKAKEELLKKKIEAEEVLQEVKKARHHEAEALQQANCYILPPNAVNKDGVLNPEYLDLPPSPTKRNKLRRRLSAIGGTIGKVILLAIGSLLITLLAYWLTNQGGIETIKHWLGI